MLARRCFFKILPCKGEEFDIPLFPGGYATVNGTAVTFHYYTQDYIGNTCKVI